MFFAIADVIAYAHVLKNIAKYHIIFDEYDQALSILQESILKSIAFSPCPVARTDPKRFSHILRATPPAAGPWMWTGDC